MVPQFEPRSRRPNVLIVEDEVLIRAIVADELRLAGLGVIEASNADEALTYIESAGAVDMVFTDIQMPGSMSGLDLARRLRAKHPTLPIIITSGNAGVKGAEGLGEFMPKPYDVEQAVNLVFSALGIPRPEAAP